MKRLTEAQQKSLLSWLESVRRNNDVQAILKVPKSETFPGVKIDTDAVGWLRDLTPVGDIQPDWMSASKAPAEDNNEAPSAN